MEVKIGPVLLQESPRRLRRFTSVTSESGTEAGEEDVFFPHIDTVMTPSKQILPNTFAFSPTNKENEGRRKNRMSESSESVPTSIQSSPNFTKIPKIPYRRGKSKEVVPLADPEDPPEKEKSWQEKWMSIGIGVGKGICLLALLYFFVVSLDLLSLGFRLLGGRTAGEIFKQSGLLRNPVVGVMIGILTTVLVQSSSTATSIIVGMVSAGFMEVDVAIPLVMGSNIGTSITNTIVSFSQAGDRDQFRLAFAGATILDMFNWVTVVVLLVVEVATGYLFHLSKAVMNGLMPDTQSGGEIQLLSVLTKPFVNLIVQLDKNVLDCWSNPNCTDGDNLSLIKENCGDKFATVSLEEVVKDPTGIILFTNTHTFIQELNTKCNFIFAGTSLSDAAAGGIILFISLVTLCSCLILIVKVLNSVLAGPMRKVISKTINADIPYVPWLTGYVAILIGALMTFLVQSSSVFTSALTPLVGLGVISLERVYPLTLGSNIGTTTTALLASMAVEGKAFFPSMQIALCHLFFNLTGILLFYPIPFTRIPIKLAMFMGNTTAKYRWFAVVYMVFMFAIIPAIFIGLSFAGPIYVICLVSLIAVLGIIVGILKIIQNYRPQILPIFLQNWKFLPEFMRSLAPYDRIFTKCPCKRKGDNPEDGEKLKVDEKGRKLEEGNLERKQNNNNDEESDPNPRTVVFFSDIEGTLC